MFAGHIGAGLALGRFERRVNVGGFVFAALLLDFVLWLLVLLGWEAVTIPADFARTHQPQFVFPYSHGLLGSIGWSALASSAALLVYPGEQPAKLRVALLVAAAVWSHWLLDALVHAPELPLAGNDSIKLGLGLWQTMPLALGIEALLTVAGLGLFLSGSGLPRARQGWLALLVVAVLAFTVIGMTVAPAPPSITIMAISSLVTIVTVCALVRWLGRAVPARR